MSFGASLIVRGSFGALQSLNKINREFGNASLKGITTSTKKFQLCWDILAVVPFGLGLYSYKHHGTIQCDTVLRNMQTRRCEF